MAPGQTIPEYDDPRHAAGYGKRPATTAAESRVIRALLAPLDPGLTVLDLPCGNGRLAPLLRSLGPAALFGADGAHAMVGRGAPRYDQALVGDAASIPLAAGSVDVVVCVRLLHHFGAPASRRAILSELARVARRRVLFSFYCRSTLQGLRRSLRRSARVALPLRRVRAEARSVGLRVLRTASLLPLVREQTFVLAEPTGAPNRSRP